MLVSLLNGLVAGILLVERYGDLLLDGVDVLLQFLEDHVLEHVGDAVEVDLVGADLGLDHHLRDGLADEAEPAAPHLAADEAQPQHAVELFDRDLQLHRDVDERQVGCADLYHDLPAEVYVRVDHELFVFGAELLHEQDLWGQSGEFEVDDHDFSETWVGILVEGDVDLLGDGLLEELAFAPFGVGHEEEAVQQTLVLLSQDIPGLEVVDLLQGEILSDVNFAFVGGLEEVDLVVVGVGGVGHLLEVLAVVVEADHPLLVVEELDEGDQQNLLESVLVLLVDVPEETHLADHLLQLLVVRGQFGLQQAVFLADGAVLQRQAGQDPAALRAALAELVLHRLQLGLVVFPQLAVHPFQIGQDVVDSFGLRRQLFEQRLEVLHVQFALLPALPVHPHRIVVLILQLEH